MAPIVVLRPPSGLAARLSRSSLAGHLPWVAAIFVLAFVLRVLWVLYVDADATHDGAFYWHAAESLASGEEVRSRFNPDEYVARPPGYPLVLASLLVVFGSSLIVAKLFNVILGAATAVLVYAVAAKLRDQRTGIVAGLLMALFPSHVFFTTTLMTETFFVALAAVLVLLLTLWLADTGSMKGWQVFALGLFLGFMSLVRADALVLAPALVVLWKLCGQRWREVGRYALLLVAGMALLIAPWTARNYVRLDEFVLVQGKAESPERMVRTGLSPNYDDLGRFGSIGEPLTFGAIAERYGTQPWQLAVLGARKIEDLFGNDDPFHWIRRVDYVGRSWRPALSPEATSRWSALGNAYYYVVGVGVLLSVPLWFSLRDRRRLILIWFIVSWGVVHLALKPAVRYHFPILPMMSVLAAYALVTVWDRLGEIAEQARSGRGGPTSAQAGRERTGPADG